MDAYALFPTPHGSNIFYTTPPQLQLQFASQTMAYNLPPLPQPGLPLFPGFTARKPETFLMKGRDTLSSKASALISFATQMGEVGAPFLELKEDKRKNI